MTMGDDDSDVNGNGATGNEVNNDGDDDDDYGNNDDDDDDNDDGGDDGGRRRRQQVDGDGTRRSFRGGKIKVSLA